MLKQIIIEEKNDYPKLSFKLTITPKMVPIGLPRFIMLVSTCYFSLVLTHKKRLQQRQKPNQSYSEISYLWSQEY